MKGSVLRSDSTARGRDTLIEVTASRREQRLRAAVQTRRRQSVIATATAVAVLVTPVGAVLLASPARAATNLVVNDTGWQGGPDAAPGDGICANAAGTCTLRAAIHEANALGGGPDEIVITVDPAIPAGSVMTGTPNAAGDRMFVASAATAVSIDTGYGTAGGAMFHITAPMTIDLDNRLLPDGGSNDTGQRSLFFVDAPHVSLFNVDQPLASAASFVFGPNAADVVVDGMHNGQRSRAITANYNPDRFAVFRDGSQRITVSGYQLQGFSHANANGGLFVFNAMTTSTSANPGLRPIRDITIEDIHVAHPAGTGGTCSGTTATGCRARVTHTAGVSATNSDAVRIEGLTFRRMRIENTNRQVFDFVPDALTGGGTVGSGTGRSSPPWIHDLTIEDNELINNPGMSTDVHQGLIVVPIEDRLTGTTLIRHNLFYFSAGTANSNRTAIRVLATYSYTSTQPGMTRPSGIYITDNHFDGYTGSGTGNSGATVTSERVGTITMTGNTFGPRNTAQTNTVYEERHGGGVGTGSANGGGPAGGGMLRNQNASSNQNILTWFPSRPAAPLAGAAPGGALEVVNERLGPQDLYCVATVPVERPTATGNAAFALPGGPVTLQVYWTATHRAEVYLGTVTGVAGGDATLVVNLPIGEITLPGPDGTTTRIVDPATGMTSGYLRVQTHVERADQLQSSQFSRTVPLTGDCAPVLTIDHDETHQPDPTLERFLRFVVTSTSPLEAGSLTAANVDLAVAPTAATTDAARINPRVISVNETEDGAGKSFEVLVAVDDSAEVTASIPVNAVEGVNGIRNQAPASSADAAVTFINPLGVTPTHVGLVAGDSIGQAFQLFVRAGAPPVKADLIFTAATQDGAGAPALTTTPGAPTLAAGETWTPDIMITAAAGDVPVGTISRVHHTVKSDDEFFDQLVVPSLEVSLFSTDPRLRIERLAFTDVTDATTAATIMATGTSVVAGASLLHEQPVCFVWRVTNISADDWESAVTNVVVTDTDTRLGADGVIATIAELGIGEQQLFAECTTLLPADSRPGAVAVP